MPGNDREMNDPLVNEARIRDWLRRKRAMNTPLCLLGALALSISGLLVLLITAYVSFFSFLYGWMGIASAWEIVAGHALTRWPAKEIGWATAGFLVLLFVGAARSKWWERGDIPKGVWSIYSNRENSASACASVVGTARIVTDILYSGPRLLISAWRTIEKSLRYWRLDVALCASVLTLVLNAGKAVSRQELMERLPSAFPWPEVEQHLRDIKGVLFLEHGVTLTEDMRLELSQQLHASPRSHP